VVLAAGKGKRMRSDRPKVLHQVCGRPSLWYALTAARAARPQPLIFVVGHGKDEIVETVRSWQMTPDPIAVDQREPLGTGHAVRVAEDAVGDAKEVLVLAGDDPLVSAEHVRELLRVHRRTRAAASVLTTLMDDPRGYARVVRDGNRLLDLVGEHIADEDPAIGSIREVATLAYAFRREDLFRALPLVGRDNRQREYYLFDVLAILRDKGERISAAAVDLGGGMGVNSRHGLAAATRIMRRRIVERHMAAGVTFVDPDAAYIDIDVRIGRDAVIYPMTVLEGATRIGPGATIGPSTRVVDSTVGERAEVSFSVVRGSRIGPQANVGPYASLRPGTVIEEGGKAGTFVEVKASRIGKGSKVPHLTYVGDATIGRDTNVGAATVTVNYDGFEKHRTRIGDGVHIGSDTMLVAPVRIGDRAWTGAGSVITRDVPAGALAVERGEQRNVLGYDERRRARARSGRKSARGGKDGGSGKKRGGKDDRRA
jgi:bifunctional UDP-N-acetylglucosamine pyrophosphorylase / glucosamine-1-phosphate N-acetyltransferase